MNAQNGGGLLHARDVEVVYRRSRLLGRRDGGHVAVKNVTLQAARGEITGLVGESGSGKSSLGLAIAGLNDHQSGGTVLLNDSEEGEGRRPSRADIQMVFQDPVAALDPRQSIRNGLVELSRLYRGRSDWISPEDLMRKVGLSPELLSRYPHQLSGGQCQRISLARAILLRPFAIIADEPTASLDVSVQARILHLFMELCQVENLALILITHDIAVVRQVCTTVNVMKSGVIVEAGLTEEVLNNPQHPYTINLLDSVPGRRFMELTSANIPTSSARPLSRLHKN